MRPFLVRRWPWIAGAAVLALVVAVPVAIRARGRAHLAAAKARLAGLGLGGGVEEYRRGAPPVDAALQARWHLVVARAAPIAPRGVDWMNNGIPGPAECRIEYDAASEILADAAAVLADGPPVAGAMGAWLAGGAGPANIRSGLRIENLLGVRNLSRLFLVQAAFEADPGPSLDALDRMHAAFARPGCLLDAMIGLCISEARDEAYVRLAAARRLPPAAGERWMAEDPVEPFRLIHALRGERLLFLEPLVDGLESGAIPPAFVFGGLAPSSNPVRWIEQRSQASGWWLHGSEAAARILEFQGGVEAALRGGRAAPAWVPAEDTAGRLAESIYGNMTAATASCFMDRQRHRMARAFVRLCGRPAADLREGVLVEGGPRDLPIVLELPAPGRIRVRVDTKAPAPEALGGLALPDTLPAPGGTTAPFLIRHGWIEAALPR